MIAWTSTPPEGASKGLLMAALVARFLVAAFFVFLAIKNLSGDEQMASDFRRWGYSDGFRVFTAGVQIVGAVLLVWLPLSFFGAALLAGLLMGAIWTHVRHDPVATVTQPVMVLVPIVLFLLFYRPVALR